MSRREPSASSRIVLVILSSLIAWSWVQEGFKHGNWLIVVPLVLSGFVLYILGTLASDYFPNSSPDTRQSRSIQDEKRKRTCAIALRKGFWFLIVGIGVYFSAVVFVNGVQSQFDWLHFGVILALAALIGDTVLVGLRMRQKSRHNERHILAVSVVGIILCAIILCAAMLMKLSSWILAASVIAACVAFRIGVRNIH